MVYVYTADILVRIRIYIYVYMCICSYYIYIPRFILVLCLVNVCLFEYILGNQSKMMVAVEKGNSLLCSQKGKVYIVPLDTYLL